MLRGLPRDLILLLRYFAPPLIGALIVWAFDADHDVINVIGRSLAPLSPSDSWWALGALLLVVGALVFSIHRAVFMHVVGRLIHRILMSRRDHPLSLAELDFSRYRRRVAPIDSAERGAQTVLDQANAAVDLFYCCAWNAAVLILLLRMVAWSDLELSDRRLLGISIALLTFIAVGLWSHYHTSRRDLEAYDRFDGLRKNLLVTMLRDERWPGRWRTLETLRHVIALDAESTKQLLLEVRARASEDGQDKWGLLEYHPLPGPMPNTALEPTARSKEN